MAELEITVLTNGPLKVSGAFVLRDAQGKAFDLSGQTLVFLCRCGHSQNKPFCDGAHKNHNFQSDCPARKLAPKG